MNQLRCIIADDEPIAREILARYIEAVPSLELVASCKDAFEVIAQLQVEAVDVLFLDINMPKLSGLGLLKTLKNRPEVVLTTAYPEYALEGFDLAVADYLLKPFSLERFMQAVMRVQQLSRKTGQAAAVETPAAAPPSADSIFVKSDKKLVKIALQDIQYVEAYGNYVKIHADKLILTPQTLTEFLAKLPAQDFVRIHKSYLLNFSKLKSMEGNMLILENQTQLPVGKSYRKSVLERIAGH